MDTWFYFILKKESSELSILEELSSCNLQNISFLEDLETGEKTLYATAEKDSFPSTWNHVSSYAEIPSEIDWGSEWASFSPYFRDGLVKIPLSDFSDSSNEEIHLLPGPGFGDLSHPTTFLSLELLSKHSQGHILIDLGCGSGILGLAALKWGADFVYSLDIDPEAALHTQKNAVLNQLEKQLLASLTLPKNPSPSPTLLVMNMTFGDQKQALNSLAKDHPLPFFWITSGILESQKKTYLSWAKKQGLTLKSSISKEGWIACLFTRDNPHQL